ncbi:MAG TPA: hypothetical protein VGC74_02225 [Stenotrophomonas sp.]|jgi:hypothetical protein
MNRLVRQLSRWLRLPALALLVLAVLANPVLAAVGDLHEASRGTATHLHSAQDHDLSDQAAYDGDDASGQFDDLLHALVHAAHCCGHLTAVPSVALSATGLWLPSPSPECSPMLRACGSFESPIRPPIAA